MTSCGFADFENRHGSPVKKDKAPKGDDDKATRMLFGL
jgi:hypothetical protein